jgi:hypothetical protein
MLHAEQALIQLCSLKKDLKLVRMIKNSFNSKLILSLKIVSCDASDKMLKYALKERWERRKERNFDNWGM